MNFVNNFRESVSILGITVMISRIGLDPVEYLEFDYASLQKWFSNKEYGKTLENALRSIWMNTYMKTVVQTDASLIKNIKKGKTLKSVSEY